MSLFSDTIVWAQSFFELALTIMTNEDKPKSVFKPFGWQALTWAAIVEAAVKTGEHVFEIPPGYTSVYSVLAGQAIEAVRIQVVRSAYIESKAYLAQLDAENLPSDIPEQVRQCITTPVIAKAKTILDEDYQKWLSAALRVLEKNPSGMRPGLKPRDLL
ncbi:MAG: hypothetical protein ABJN26_06210 [Stappiaceae bacterium]